MQLNIIIAFKRKDVFNNNIIYHYGSIHCKPKIFYCLQARLLLTFDYSCTIFSTGSLDMYRNIFSIFFMYTGIVFPCDTSSNRCFSRKNTSLSLHYWSIKNNKPVKLILLYMEYYQYSAYISIFLVIWNEPYRPVLIFPSIFSRFACIFEPHPNACMVYNQLS